MTGEEKFSGRQTGWTTDSGKVRRETTGVTDHAPQATPGLCQ
jgi:hypothetical protein